MRTDQEREVATVAIRLMRGVVYREADTDGWAALERTLGPVRDHFGTIGLQVVVDDIEGYAFLRAQEDDQDDEPLPRLVRRRALSYPVSLLLVLLRKRLVEFESSGGEGRLVLTRDQIVEMLRIFLPDSTNEARMIDQVDTTIRKVVELGFLRPLRRLASHWEVQRILKAYVDAQTLGDLAGRLTEYAEAQTLRPGTEDRDQDG